MMAMDARVLIVRAHATAPQQLRAAIQFSSETASREHVRCYDLPDDDDISRSETLSSFVASSKIRQIIKPFVCSLVFVSGQSQQWTLNYIVPYHLNRE
jgi:hypothetical protein